MAINGYIEMEGIEGNSQIKAGAVDVLSFSFGASMPISYGAGGSGFESTAGQVSVSDFSFMMMSNKTTPEIFGHCCAGHHIPKVTMTYLKQVGDAQEAFFKVLVEDVLFSSVQLSGSQEAPIVSVSCHGEKVKVSYNPEDNEGKLAGFIDRGWDLGTNTKW